MDKLKGINPGDRVRVTFEGEVDALTSEWLSISVDDGDAVNNTFSRDDINSPHFHIERIEKPLAVGDRVKLLTNDADYVGSIKGIEEGVAWVRYEARLGMECAFYDTEKLSDLERVS